jgi:hypothetical protein
MNPELRFLPSIDFEFHRVPSLLLVLSLGGSHFREDHLRVSLALDKFLEHCVVLESYVIFVF